MSIVVIFPPATLFSFSRILRNLWFINLLILILMLIFIGSLKKLNWKLSYLACWKIFKNRRTPTSPTPKSGRLAGVKFHLPYLRPTSVFLLSLLSLLLPTMGNSTAGNWLSRQARRQLFLARLLLLLITLQGTGREASFLRIFTLETHSFCCGGLVFPFPVCFCTDRCVFHLLDRGIRLEPVGLFPLHFTVMHSIISTPCSLAHCWLSKYSKLQRGLSVSWVKREYGLGCCWTGHVCEIFLKYFFLNSSDCSPSKFKSIING